MLKFAFLWFILLAAAFLNAAIRELTYKKIIGDPWSNQVSVVPGVVLLGIAMWFITAKWKPANIRQAWRIGLVWLLMTEAFEFSMVVLFSGKSLDYFLNAHNLLRGEFWPVILVWVAIAPWLFYKIRSR